MPAIEFSAKSFLDDIPAVAGLRVGLVILQPLVEDLAMPFRDRNCLGTCCDSVPQRLQIVDLLVDRQVVETRRRQRDRFRHLKYVRTRADCVQYTAALFRRSARRSESSS